MAKPRRTALVIAAAALAFACVFAFGCGSKPKFAGCKADQDCKSGQVCVANACVACNADSQCPSGERCSDHACVADVECKNDAMCTGGKVCQAGSCKACAADSECGPGGTCVAGGCQRAKACKKDDECADDEDCKAGLCMKASKVSANDAPCALQTVYFNFDQAKIEDSEKTRLSTNYDCIQKATGKAVFLVGHTDTSGTEEYNIALSERRAQTVADYLARLGTDPARMQIIPKGETEPTGLGDDKDRRVEFQWH